MAHKGESDIFYFIIHLLSIGFHLVYAFTGNDDAFRSITLGTLNRKRKKETCSFSIANRKNRDILLRVRPRSS